MTEEEKIAAAIAEALKPIKASLDSSYAERDAAKAEAKALKEEKQAATDAAAAKAVEDKAKADLEAAEKAKAEGDFKALHQMEIAAAQGKLTATEEALRKATADAATAAARVAELAEKNSKLARDAEIGIAVRRVSFASERAASIAIAQIAGEMTFADNVWKHSSGKPLSEAIDIFVAQEENAFLLKQTASSGAGGSPLKPGAPSTKLTTADIVKLAQQGKLPQN